jgi:xylulose-5-phosphate/fructose-6-phosphate phosphoketolase
VDALLPSPEELFEESGALRAELARLRRRPASGAWAPTRTPTAACCCATSSCPTSGLRGRGSGSPGSTTSEATRVLGTYLRDVMRDNADNFRIMGPDETASNRLGAVFEATNRTWEAQLLPSDDHLGPTGA